MDYAKTHPELDELRAFRIHATAEAARAGAGATKASCC
jgi:hypothetical protein